MPNVAPRGEAVTVLMTVDSTSHVSLHSGGTRISEHIVENNLQIIPQTVAALRFGATDPNGYNPGTFLLEQVSAWASPLSDAHSGMVSMDLDYVPAAEVPQKPVVSIPAALTVKEGDTLQIPITKEGSGACSVQLKTVDGTAASPADYTGFQQTFSFGASDTIINVPLVTVLDADNSERDEKLKMELSPGVSDDCVLGNANGEITISQAPRISVTSSSSVKEGGTLSVIVSKVGTGACSVTWRTSPDTATVTGADYTGVGATTLSFGVAETQKTITVTTLSDTAVEPTEFFNILIENPQGCTVSSGTCRVSILDEDSPDAPTGTAYTTASGFASAADCGLGLPVYLVTNLNDSGTGSLRAGAVPGNCMIVFEVAGTIELLSRLSVGANCTIAGETAPAPGITIIKGDISPTSFNQSSIHIVRSNIRISHITFQKGYHDNINLGNSDVAMIAPTPNTAPASPKTVVENIHFRHCAFYWGLDETVQLWPADFYDLKNISFHDCIFAEALHRPSSYDATLKDHTKVQADGFPHNYGMLIGYNTRNIDVQYSLFSNLDMRSPFIDHSTDVVLANNIANNCTKGATIQQNANPKVYRVSCKGYLCISGPNTGTSWYAGFYFNSYANPQPANSRVYVTGLYAMKGGPANSPYQMPGTEVKYKLAAGCYWESGADRTRVDVLVQTAPIDTPGGTETLEKQALYDRALVNVGPRPKEIRKLMEGTMTIGNKDVRRSVQQLKDRTGRWVNHQGESDIGGYYKPERVDRKLDAAAKFDDGSPIGDVPDQPQPATEISKANMKNWLRKHLTQIQSD